MKNPRFWSAIFICCLCLSTRLLFSQTQYTLAESTATFTELTVATPLTFSGNDDGVSQVITIPFSFTFFGQEYTTFQATTNGYINFNTDASWNTYSNNFSHFDDPIIAPLWDDLAFDEIEDNAVASYKVEGISPNQICTIEFLYWRWRWTADDEVVSFQIKLYESNDKIEFHYRQEPGSPETPSATIGISNGQGRFYSLTNIGGAVTLDPDGDNLINSHPGNNKVFSLTPGASTITTPTLQSSNILVTPAGQYLDFSWTRGDGAYCVAFIKETTSTTETFLPTNGSAYVADSNYDEDWAFGEWWCVYNGTGNTVQVSGLEPGRTYRLQVFEYNGLAGLQDYLTTSNTNNPVNGETLLTTPTEPFSTLSVRNVGATKIKISLEQGNGTYRAVFVKAGNSGFPAVEDDLTYEGDLIFGNGDQVGTSGWYCVFNGEDFGTLTINGLSDATEYRVVVVDYNGDPGEEKYNNTETSSNTVQLTTYNLGSETYTFTATTGSFTALSGGTAINEIESDFGVSNEIQIGFDFEFNGNTFTKLVASSDGIISFSDYALENYNFSTNSLSESNFNPLLAPLWDDLSGSGGTASYLTSGSAGSRVFTIEYKNWRWGYSSAAAISFQVKLYETTNVIEYIYKRESGDLAFPSASIGIGLVDAGEFMSLSDVSSDPEISSVSETNTIGEKPATGQIYKFSVKQNQTITFTGPLPAKKVSDAMMTLSATASSGLAVSYSSSNTDVAIISGGNKVKFVGVGTTSIIASQSGNDAYYPATSVELSLTVDKGDQSITFPEIGQKQFGETFSLSATASSGLTVSYVSSDPSVAKVTGSTVKILAFGTATITASQAGDANYNAAAPLGRTVTVVKADQTVTFDELTSKKYGDAAFEVNASSNILGKTISYSSSNTAVATVSGNTVTITGVGSTDITASSPADDAYNAATATQTLVVTKGDQTISFAAFVGKKAIGEVITLSATSDRGLPVAFTTDNENVVKIEGTKLTVLGSGTAQVYAKNSGNDLYNAATTIQLLESRQLQTVTFTEVADKTFGDASFTLTATSSSGLPVTFSSISNNISIEGNQVTILSAGSVSVQATQAGNSDYEPASDEISFCVNPATPVISVASGSSTPVMKSSNPEGNVWYMNGGLISGTEDTFPMDAAGSFNVQTVIDGCFSAMSEDFIVVVTGIEAELNPISIYPNPVQNEFVVDVTNLAGKLPATVTLVELSGRELVSWSGKGRIQCTLRNQSVGNYLIHIKSGNYHLVKQISKQ